MKRFSLALLCAFLLSTFNVQYSTLFAQITERPRPAHWSQLVEGARFMDRFLPMEGSMSRSDVWGADYVRPRFVDNGIEDNHWSYWGGNIVLGEDGLWHHFVAAWPEGAKKGHMEWGNSWVIHAVGPTMHGPFSPRQVVGKGHNPEIYRTDDGTWVLYVIDGRYTARSLDGPWEYGKFDFDPQGKPIIEGLSNLSFARRPEGGWLMVCRGGGIWVSDDGLSVWRQVSDGSVYPKVDGRFEDPVLWRDSVQYNLIVNDWLGRIAYYLRSADGLHWQVDDGEAYMPGIARHQDGSKEDWFKYERMRIVQDKYGRAVQANFAVIDTIKWNDKPLDRHNSKNICIPLDPGLLLTMESGFSGKTGFSGKSSSSLSLRIRAEEGFRPQQDLDLSTLRFGSPSEVDYGRGARPIATRLDGNDLILTFKRKEVLFHDDDFAGKVLVRRADGRMTFGFVRLTPLSSPSLGEGLGGLIPVPLNPFGHALVPDMIADASIQLIDDTFYCYATTDGYGRGLETSGPPVVWKSKDFIHWSFNGTYFPSAEHEKYWAPSKAVQRGDKWYIYPTVNGFMHVAEANSPDGPFRLVGGVDQFEKPYTPSATLLQGEDRGGIDAEAFIDDDGQAYIFWGRHHVGKLAEDMRTVTDVRTLETRRKEYSEGPIFFKRKGIYYYLYTIGGNENYEYYYMMSRTSPFGPYETPQEDRVSTTNIDKGVFGPGHGSVFNVGEDYYFAFLEFSRNSTNRQTYVNRMEFNEDGTIRPVEVTMEGVGELRVNNDNLNMKNEKYKLLKPTSVTASSTRAAHKIRYFNDSRCQRFEYFVADFATDGANGSRWMASDTDSLPTLTLDLGKAQTIHESRIAFVRPTAGHAYRLEGSTDGQTWQPCGGHADLQKRSPHTDLINKRFRYLRITITEGVKGVWEWEVN
jgi:hypothetical protein